MCKHLLMIIFLSTICFPLRAVGNQKVTVKDFFLHYRLQCNESLKMDRLEVLESALRYHSMVFVPNSTDISQESIEWQAFSRTHDVRSGGVDPKEIMQS